MKIVTIIIRMAAIVALLAGLFGYTYSTLLAICMLGLLNIAYGIEFWMNKEWKKTVSSMVIGVCVLILAFLQMS